jgi:hypothetical protein
VIMDVVVPGVDPWEEVLRTRICGISPCT